jgi:mannose-1-phosphate guanylyltransferase / mannose-6-phosphate isomerase
MSSPALCPVILSGGAGTRLWPISREISPKAFIRLPDGESLLEKTAARANSLPGVAELITVTDRELYFRSRDLYARMGNRRPRQVSYVLEPFGRNTAPAVALGALLIESRLGGDAVMLVLPADHLIRDQSAFATAIARAVTLAEQGLLVTFGIAPTHAETGFGYLECGVALEGVGGPPPAFRALHFVEKPDEDAARRFVAAGNFAWNSGMFCFKVSAILDALARYAGPLLDAVRPCVGTPQSDEIPVLEIDPDRFARVPEISLDQAVMEPAAAAGEVAIVRGTFDWIDVGSWQAVAELNPPDAEGNVGHGERVAVATRNTFVFADRRVVATVGVDNLAIIDTPDALLVADRDALHRVRDVVAKLKERGHESYRESPTVTRPWGTFTVLNDGPGFKVKRIEIYPGAAMSLQLHRQRTEHWTVVAGTARVTHGERGYDLGTHGFATILPGEKHRLENLGSDVLVIIEVQCGDYLGEDDIVRFEDRYGRAKQ